MGSGPHKHYYRRNPDFELPGFIIRTPKPDTDMNQYDINGLILSVRRYYQTSLLKSTEEWKKVLSSVHHAAFLKGGSSVCDINCQTWTIKLVKFSFGRCK